MRKKSSTLELRHSFTKFVSLQSGEDLHRAVEIADVPTGDGAANDRGDHRLAFLETRLRNDQLLDERADGLKALDEKTNRFALARRVAQRHVQRQVPEVLQRRNAQEDLVFDLRQSNGHFFRKVKEKLQIFEIAGERRRRRRFDRVEQQRGQRRSTRVLHETRQILNVIDVVQRRFRRGRAVPVEFGDVLVRILRRFPDRCRGRQDRHSTRRQRIVRRMKRNLFVEQGETFDVDDLPEVDGDGPQIGRVVQLQTPFRLVSKFEDEFVDAGAELVAAGDPMFQIGDALFAVDHSALRVDQTDFVRANAEKAMALKIPLSALSNLELLQDELFVSIVCREFPSPDKFPRCNRADSGKDERNILSAGSDCRNRSGGTTSAVCPTKVEKTFLRDEFFFSTLDQL